MGQVISIRSDQDDIFNEVKTVVTASAALGGTVAEIAAKELAPIHAEIGELDAMLLSVREIAAPLTALVDVARAKANEAVRLAYDMTWNYVGRPAHDKKLSLMYPGGASHYIDGDAEKQPVRMELLARLYDKGVHPKLSGTQNKDMAEAIRAAAKVYGDAIEAARLPATEVTLLERTRTVMARTAQVTLVNFKRHLKMAGFTEAQVHAIIPDRKQPPGKKAAAKQAAAGKADVEAPEAPAPAEASPTPA